MKLMVVGHPFLLAYNQQKFVAMKRIDKSLQLRLVVPSFGRDRFEPTSYQVHPELSAEEVVPLTPYLAKSHMTYLHAPQRLAKVLRSFQPDVLHIELEPQAFITVETIALRKLFAPGAAISLFSWDNILRPRRFPLGIAKRWLRAWSLRQTSVMICGNREAAERLHAEGKFAGATEVLPQYGLDVNEHAPGTEPELRHELELGEASVVGYFGRMVPEKGLRTLLQALVLLQNHSWKLLLVGSGPLEQEIRERWMPMLAGRVVLLPPVPYEQVSRYLRCTDIFVLASQTTPTWKEQFGLALAQAMMLGIASIGSDSGAIPDTLGSDGTIVKENNVEALRHALENFLTSPVSRARAAAAGRTHALKNYTVQHIAERYLNIFESARSLRSTGRETTTETLELETLGRKV